MDSGKPFGLRDSPTPGGDPPVDSPEDRFIDLEQGGIAPGLRDRADAGRWDSVSRRRRKPGALRRHWRRRQDILGASSVNTMRGRNANGHQRAPALARRYVDGAAWSSLPSSPSSHRSAMPTYRQYLIRSQRSEAKIALLQLQTAQEKFYMQNNAFADDANVTTAAPAGLGLMGVYRDRQVRHQDHGLWRRRSELYCQPPARAQAAVRQTTPPVPISPSPTAERAVFPAPRVPRRVGVERQLSQVDHRVGQRELLPHRQ